MTKNMTPHMWDNIKHIEFSPIYGGHSTKRPPRM